MTTFAADAAPRSTRHPGGGIDTHFHRWVFEHGYSGRLLAEPPAFSMTGEGAEQC